MDLVGLRHEPLLILGFFGVEPLLELRDRQLQFVFCGLKLWVLNKVSVDVSRQLLNRLRESTHLFCNPVNSAFKQVPLSLELAHEFTNRLRVGGGSRRELALQILQVLLCTVKAGFKLFVSGGLTLRFMCVILKIHKILCEASAFLVE